MDIDLFFAEKAYAETTVRNYRWFLEKLETFLEKQDQDIESLTAVELKNWLHDHDWNHNSRYTGACAVKAYLKWTDPNHPALRMRVKRNRTKPQRVLNFKQAQKVLNHFDTSDKGIRDLAITALMLDTGLRLFEVIKIQISNLKIRENSVHVHIKNNRWEIAVFSDITAHYLDNRVKTRKSLIAPGVEELFVAVGGENPGHPLTSGGLRSIIYKTSQQIGIQFSAHDLRRTFTTLSLQNGAPTRVVQKAGRWKDIRMVERYSPTIRPKDMEPYFPVPSLRND